MNKPNKAAIYCRASADPGAFEPENVDSLAYQAGSAMAFLEDHHLDFCGLYVDDKSLSEWEALMRDCARGNIDVVVVRDISVISSEYEIITALEKSLPTLVIGAEDLYYTNESFNLETFEFEHDTHRPTTSESIQDRIEEGRFFGRVPFGYEKTGNTLAANPETAKIVREIFDAARNGHRPAKIRDYLNQMQTPTPGKSKSWSRDSVVNILTNDVYCGTTHIESLISKTVFEQTKEALAERKYRMEPEPFPMARCDVCNGKLIYQKAGSIPRLRATTYRCDKHTGINPSGARLEQTPRITIEELEKAVLVRCNEFLDKSESLPEDQENRASKVIELGEKVLAGDDAGDEYEGLWASWYNGCGQIIKYAARRLLRRQVQHMDEYDPEIGMRIIRSLRLREDGSVAVKFWGEDAC